MPEKEQSQLSDGDLFERLRSGDEQAWEVFVERFSRLLHAIPFRYFGDDGVIEDVEDIVQMTLLKLVENLENINEPEKIQAWLVTTSKRNGTGMTGKPSWRREMPLYVTDDGEPYKPESVPSVEEELIRNEDSEEIYKSFLELDERSQELIILLFLDQSNPEYVDIANKLDIPLGSMGPTRMRTLKSLREILEGGEEVG